MALRDITGERERGAAPRRSNVVKSVFLCSVNTHTFVRTHSPPSSVREPRANTLTNRYVSRIIYNQAHRDHRFLRSFGIPTDRSTSLPRIAAPAHPVFVIVQLSCNSNTLSRSTEIDNSIALRFVCSRFYEPRSSLFRVQDEGERRKQPFSLIRSLGEREGEVRDTEPTSFLFFPRAFFFFLFFSSFFFLSLYPLPSSNDFSRSSLSAHSSASEAITKASVVERENV